MFRKYVEKDVELELNKEGNLKFLILIENLDRDKRIESFYLPYTNLLRESLEYIRPEYVLSVHTFTKNYEDLENRNFEIGILYRRRGKFAAMVNNLKII